MYKISESTTAPDFIRDLKIWLLWGAPGEKVTKQPYYAFGGKRHGEQNSPVELEKLVDFETAKAQALKRGFLGVGVAPRRELDITIIDLDTQKSLIEDIPLPPEALSLSGGHYAEWSPSGTGVHFICKGIPAYPGNKKDNANEENWGLELFFANGFVTFTGNPLPTSKSVLAPASEHLKATLLHKFGDPLTVKTPSPAARLGMSDAAIKDTLSWLDPADPDHDKWVMIGMGIHFETQGSAAGLEIFLEWSRGGGRYFKGDDHVRDRWRSFKDDKDDPVSMGYVLKLATARGAPRLTGSVDESDWSVIVTEHATPDMSASHYFKGRSVGAFLDKTVRAPWLVKGFLKKANVGLIFGPSASGKSFIALDICAALARGASWNNHPANPDRLRVLFVVAEGVDDFADRIRVYLKHNALTPGDVSISVISDVIPNMCNPESAKNLLDDIREMGLFDLVVIDTLAQVTAGADENNGKEIGMALKHCRMISMAAKTMVILVHHSGKDTTKGPRGWSGIFGACDVIYGVSKEDGINGVLEVVKQKGGKSGHKFGFTLPVVQLDECEDGEIPDSCIVEYGPVATPEKPRKLRANQEVVYNAMLEFSPGSWVTLDSLISICMENTILAEGVKDNRRSNIARTISTMIGVFLDKNENGEVSIKQ